MKKQFRLLFIAAVFPFMTFSQTEAGIGVGIMKSTLENSVIFNGGNLFFSEGNLLFFGGDFYLKRGVSEAVRAGASIGFYNSTKEYVGGTQRTNQIPITVGLDYAFLKNDLRPYLGINVGLLLTNVSNPSGTGNVFQPIFSPLAGLDYKFSEHLGANLNFKFNLIFFRDDSTAGPDITPLLSPNIGLFYRF